MEPYKSTLIFVSGNSIIYLKLLKYFFDYYLVINKKKTGGLKWGKMEERFVIDQV